VASLASHDLLSVTQSANLDDGIVHLTFTGGFGPSLGDSFEFIDAGTGAYGNTSSISVAVTGLANGFEFDPIAFDGSTPGGVTLTAQTAGVAETDTTLFFGSTRNDIFDGGAGNDVLDGGGGNDTLDGGNGHDQLFGGDGNDILQDTGWGWDTLDGGTGIDEMRGGAGNDNYVVDNAGDQVIELASEGTDLVRTAINYTLGNHVENGLLLGAGNIFLAGNALANTLTGNAGNNILNGRGGADRMFGNGGNDMLNGGAGADELFGGDGNDVYFVDNVGDKVTEEAGGGTDTVNSSISFALWTQNQHLENLKLTGGGSINGTGNGQANIIDGNNGNNILNGGFGNDLLRGGNGNDTFMDVDGADEMRGWAGNDTYHVDNVGDTIVENANQGTDSVFSSVSFALRDQSQHLEDLTLTGNAAINGDGNGLANTITGNVSHNVLNGAWGNDTLIGGSGWDVFMDDAGADHMDGGGGNDTFHVDNAGDTVVERAGEGTDTVISSIAFSLWDFGQHLENLTLTGNSAINGNGNGQNNVLRGNVSHNALNAGAGNDTVFGGTGWDRFRDSGGNDTFSGEGGSDTFFFKDNFGTDTITDFDVADANEKINLSDVANITDFADLQANHLSTNGSGHAVITDGASSITLTNVTLGSLTVDEFEFV
jgi:Ca2+-binding RTX toxin-like protein